MDFKKFIKQYSKSRTVIFYIALGASILSVIAGLIACAQLSAYGTAWHLLICSLAGLIVFLVLSLLGLDNMGAAASALLNLLGFALFLVGEYNYFFVEIQNQAMVGFDIFAVDGMMALIVCIVLNVACSVVLNVCAWLKLRKLSEETQVAA